MWPFSKIKESTKEKTAERIKEAKDRQEYNDLMKAQYDAHIALIQKFKDDWFIGREFEYMGVKMKVTDNNKILGCYPCGDYLFQHYDKFLAADYVDNNGIIRNINIPPAILDNYNA